MTVMKHNKKIGARAVTLAQLQALPEPEKLGPRHFPVSHADFLESIEKEIKSQLGAKVTHRDLAVGKGLQGGVDAALFGILTLNYGEHKDRTAAIGIRHAHDMSIAMQMVAGSQVFVCDNMVLRGDIIMLKRKHTTGLNLQEEVAAGMAKFKAHYGQLDEMIGTLKTSKISDDRAKALMHDAHIHGVMPGHLARSVDKEYFHPRHAEFEPRTMWSLHNAFTEVLKTVPGLLNRSEHTQELGRMFGMEAPEA